MRLIKFIYINPRMRTIQYARNVTSVTAISSGIICSNRCHILSNLFLLREQSDS